ncbi:MAG: response regulator [Burkholderiaceae bacterium]
MRRGSTLGPQNWVSMTFGETVLVVDDDDSMRQAIERLLGSAGFETAAYSSAEALLAGVEIDGATCVVSDLKLPAMSGFELLTELRARGAQLPLILITAHDEAKVRDQAARLGVAAYLTKPFLGTELLAAIERSRGYSN